MPTPNIGSLTQDVTKTFKTRIIQKHDTEVNWQKATNFVPKKGEIIVYDIDSDHNYERIKIGDGEHISNDLPFVTDNYYTKSETDTKLNGKQAQLNTTQLAAVNSGITNDKVTKYDNYQSQIASKYEKPDRGIPKTDLSSAIQDSLEKADTAIQQHQKITTGGANGTIAVDGTDVAVKGLKALAYKDSLTKADVGLGNVNNTSDKEKPISTATQEALDGKQNLLSTTQLNAVNSGVTSAKVTTYDGYQSQIDGKYTKPTGGIPKTDLASSVQTSLGKADTALQTHQKIATGSANGTISVDGTDVSVKGLGSLAYKNSLTKSDVGLGSVVNAGQDSTPTANSTNYVTSGGVKNYVDTAISGVSQFKYEVVASLPTASASTMGKIYLVAHSHSSDDGYDEYITLESGTTTKTYSWEKIGNTDIDLSNYVNNLSGTANSGVVTNITKSGNTLTVTSSDLSGTQTASSGKYISGITQDKTGKIASISEGTLPSNTAHSHTAGTGLSVSGSGGVSGTTTYSLKVASSSEIGGVKPGTTSGKTYGVDVAEDGSMTVDVDLSNYYNKEESDAKYALLNGDSSQLFYAKSPTGHNSSTAKQVINQEWASRYYIPLTFYDMIEIPANSDMNKYVMTGNYYANSAQGVTNLPDGIESNGNTLKLTVGMASDDVSSYQILYVWSSDNGKFKGQYIRSSVGEGWQPWVKFVTNEDLSRYYTQTEIDSLLSKKADLLVNESVVTTVQAGRLYEFGDISNPFSLSIDMDTFKTSNDSSQIYFTAAANFDVTLNVSSGVRIIGDGVNASAKKISCVQGNSYYFTFGYTKKGVSIVSNIDVNWSEIATA